MAKPNCPSRTSMRCTLHLQFTLHAFPTAYTCNTSTSHPECDHASLQMKALCEVPRNGLQLLPYYARITATLSRVFPDIGQGDFAPRRLGCQPAAASTAATSCVPSLLLPGSERGKESACRLTGVEHHLESEFRLLQRRRDVVGRNAEARLCNVRFLGELVKFRLMPFGAVLSRLKVQSTPCNTSMQGCKAATCDHCTCTALGNSIARQCLQMLHR